MLHSRGLVKAIALMTATSMTACATAYTYRRVEVEPVNIVADYKGEKPVGIVEDAMRLESTPLFDQATYQRIESAAKSAKDIPSLQTKIRDAVCDGEQPRSQPKLTVRLILSRPTKGEALDVVAERNRVFINEAKIYLKQYWLNESSRLEIAREKFNSDFDLYKKDLVDTNLERKWASHRISVGVPFIAGSTAKDAEKYFASSHATPNLRPIEQTGPNEWFPGRSFLSLAFPNHTFVMSNKVSDFLISVWGQNSYGTEMDSEIAHDVQLGPMTTFRYFGMSDGFNYRNNAFFTPSKSSWKLKDGSIANPLVLSHFDDLAALKSGFSFRIPKEELARVFKTSSPLYLQYFGYDYDSGKYAASLAIAHQDYIWQHVLANQTEVTQSSQEDGSVTFELKPSFEIFCKYGVPASSLVAQ